jgi:hypothetical protein
LLSRAAINWYDSNKAFISTTLLSTTTLPTSLIRLTWPNFATSPSNAAFAQVFAGFTSAATGDVVTIDAIQLEAGTTVTSYAPNHSEILPGTINATMIQAGVVNAEALNATLTITGKTIRTAASGARVEMDGVNNKFAVYDATAERMKLDGGQLVATDAFGTAFKLAHDTGLSFYSDTVARAGRRIVWTSGSDTVSKIEVSTPTSAPHLFSLYSVAPTGSTQGAQSTFQAVNASGQRSSTIQMNSGLAAGTGDDNMIMLQNTYNDAPGSLPRETRITMNSGSSAATSKIEVLVRPDSGSNTKKLLGGDGTSDWAYASGINKTYRGFSAYRSTTQTTGAGASSGFGRIEMDAEAWDTDGWHTTGSSCKFQPTVPGYYRISLTIYFDAVNSGEEYLATIYKNGSEYRRGTQGEIAATNKDFAAHVTALVYLNGSSDYVEPYKWSDTARWIIGNAAGSQTWWQGEFVGV